MTVDEAAREARASLAAGAAQDEDRFIALAVTLAGGCPATIAGEQESKAKQERKQLIHSLVGAVAESGSKRGLTKLLGLMACGVEAPTWGRERILERAMARMIAVVPCTPPLPGEVAAEKEKLAEFPLLRLHKGGLRVDYPTPKELGDLAYFMVAVAGAGEEPGSRNEGGTWPNKAPANPLRAELFEQLGVAKAAGKVIEVERLARGYLESLNFPDTLHGDEEDVRFVHAPRYRYVMHDLAESWEALGRYHAAAGLWRRNGLAGGQSDVKYSWSEQVKSVIRDEEIEGRCEVTVPGRLLDVEGAHGGADDLYGVRRLVDARFDVARLLRGALLTVNRDAGEQVVGKAVDALPEMPRLWATMRLREKGPEDWERRLHAMRGLADVMQADAIPLLLQAAEQSLPAGRRRAIAALGDLAERPLFDPCRSVGGYRSGRAEWVRPIKPLAYSCDIPARNAVYRRVAASLFAYAKDPDRGTREAVAEALGKIASSSALPLLRRLSRDDEQAGTRLNPEGEHEYQPHFPVREAALRAISNVEEIERNWGARRP
jgi:hypothetical protein